MPKTNYCKPDSVIALDKLSNWIRRQGKQKDIAEAIGLSPQHFNQKLKNNKFSAEDLIKIFHYLHTESDEIIKVVTY